MTEYRVYKYRWIVLAVYMYVCALTQLYWLNFAAIETYIEERLGLQAAGVMWFTLVFPLVQVLLTMPAGIIIDRRGFKFGVGIGVLFIGLFAMIRLIDPLSFAVLLVSQIGIAVGQPFILNGVTKLAVTWFSHREEATAVGLGSMSLFIGMIVGLGLTPFIVEHYSYESMLMVYGIMGLVGIPLFFLLVKSGPVTPSRETDTSVREAGWRSIGQILKIRDFVILGFIALIGIGVFNGLATWLEKIMNEMHSMAMTDAGTVSAVVIFSGMLGCIIIPIVSDRVGKRKPFLLLASGIGAVTITILIFIRGYTVNMVNGIVLGLFLISALPIMLTMATEITGPEFAGISVAYLQFLGNIAAVIIVPLMEALRGASGQFVQPLILLISLLLIAFVLSIFIKDPKLSSSG
jgi:MFS family permease